jgi:hypothetical protein
MGTVKIANVEMHAKTGTSSFDSALLKELNYPSDASKDIWFAGYSPDYTTVVWSGFDYPIKGKSHYFKSGSDSRKYIPRKIFSKIMNYQVQKGQTISMPNTLIPVKVVKGTNLLPDSYTPLKMITTVYYRKGKEPKETISPPQLDNVESLDFLLMGDTLTITFKDNLFDIVDLVPTKKEFDYSGIYGKIQYIIEITNSSNETSIYISTEPQLSLNVYNKDKLKIKAYTRYANIDNLTSNIYETEYYSFPTF